MIVIFLNPILEKNNKYYEIKSQYSDKQTLLKKIILTKTMQQIFIAIS